MMQDVSYINGLMINLLTNYQLLKTKHQILQNCTNIIDFVNEFDYQNCIKKTIEYACHMSGLKNPINQIKNYDWISKNTL